MLHLQQLDRSHIHEQLDRILIAQPIAARDGVVEMILETVVVFDHSGRPAFRGDRVAAHGIHLREQADVQ
jgi:hypothetical protein